MRENLKKPLMLSKILVFVLYLILLPTAFSQTVQTELVAKFDGRTNNQWFDVYRQFGFNSQGNLFFIIDNHQKLTIWETDVQKPKYTLTGKFSEASFSPDGKRLAISFKKEITIINLETGDAQVNVNKYKNQIKFLGWNPNSRNFAVGTTDFTVDILDGETGVLKNSFVIHEKKKGLIARFFDEAGFPFQATFTPDGNKILTVCDDTTAELWDLETGKIIYTFTQKPSPPYQGASPKQPEVRIGEISPDGKWILTMSYDDARLWDANTGKLIEELVGYGFPSFSPDSRYLGLINDPAGDRSVKLLDLSTHEIKTIFAKYFGEIALWSPDSRTFITDRTTDEMSKNVAYLWETETGNRKAALKTYSKGCFDWVSTCLSDFDRFSFRPDGKILMSENNKQIKFLNPENAEVITTLGSAIAPAWWSPTGNFLLARDAEKGKIGLWRISVK